MTAAAQNGHFLTIADFLAEHRWGICLKTAPSFFPIDRSRFSLLKSQGASNENVDFFWIVGPSQSAVPFFGQRTQSLRLLCALKGPSNPRKRPNAAATLRILRPRQPWTLRHPDLKSCDKGVCRKHVAKYVARWVSHLLSV